MLFGYTDNYIRTRVKGHVSLGNTIQNVHILDPLILPEICSTTTTLTSLSNNLRIIDKIYPDEWL